MFEFLFKYPADVFRKGTFVFLGGLPLWVFWCGAILAGVVIGWFAWRRRDRQVRRARAAVLCVLQAALVALLLLLMWEPALSVTALEPQQNIVAVVVDASRSMSVRDESGSREEAAARLLDSGLLSELSKRFQVRLYRLGSGVERIERTALLRPDEPSTQIGRGLRQLADEAGTLPIGAVVLLSDGGDNSGGIDAETMAELRRKRLPINTIGLGREQLAHDIEMEQLDLPANALQGARLRALITLRQDGFAGARTRLALRAGGTTLTSREVTIKGGWQQVEEIEFSAAKAGIQSIEARIEPIEGEQNAANNSLTRVLHVNGEQRRILYIEGEPRWEYKFLRRALEDDKALEVASMLRTTQNKIYRQGIVNQSELADGFPSKAEDLFGYQGLVVGSVESAFFSASQQQAIKDFADRRGGGVLFLGGRWALGDGGYNESPLAELLPVALAQKKPSFQRTFVAAELTDAGKHSLICRIEDDPEKSAQHWEVLPYLANYQDVGTPKAGALVLAQLDAGGTRKPLLITENYGRGRTGVFATGGSWRWRMQQPVGDTSEETFWRQLLRWLVAGTPGQVVATTPNSQLEDDGRVQLSAEVRDRDYVAASDADVEARVIGPDGAEQTLPMRPEPLRRGTYAAEWNAEEAGSYIAEIIAKRGAKELGRDVVMFRRENGVAENFRREQNRNLLEKLAEETGGNYYKAADAKRLAREISYSEAGMTSREMKDLWNMPAVFLALLGLKSSEWLLRRKWGVV